MTDLTPSEEDDVSRLLHGAATPVTLPTDVAARLDDVLAGLVAERTESPVPATLAEVVPIRHRRWPKVLMAAAAVSLFGYAGQALLQNRSADDSASSADAGATVSEKSMPSGEAAAPQDSAGDAPTLTGSSLGAAASNLDQLKRNLSTRDFANSYDVQERTAAPKAFTAGRPCAVPPMTANESALEATVEGRRVVVVVRPLGGSAARADVYACRQSLFPVASTLLLDAR